MSNRKLSALEQKIHQAALSSPTNVITLKELDTLAPDPVPRTAAINFLMGSGMLKVLKDEKGRLSWRAVIKKELEAKKDMSGEESMVLGYIQASGNEGIWTKHIKAKTELHQTVLDRCFKSLTQKSLIKAVKSVKHPTRKIYMLSHLDPSVELTGGPWYSENELDTEFIRLLSRACLQFVRDRSFPRSKASAEEARPLYAIGAAPAYPNARDVQTFLSKSKITETELGVDHVEALLDVLVLDGEVERIPAFGAAMWASSVADDEVGDDGDNDDARRERKRKRKVDRERDGGKKKRKRRSRSSSPSSSDSEDEDDRIARDHKKGKGKRVKDNEPDRESRKGKKRKLDDLDIDEDEDTRRRRKFRSKAKGKGKGKKKRSRASPSDGSSSDSSSSSDTLSSSSESDSDDARSRRRSRSRSKSKSRVAANAVTFDEDAFAGGAHVYRAVPPVERSGVIGGGAGAAWSSQAPCARCPAFTFCAEGGPVSPAGCDYYGAWLERGVVHAE